MSVRHSLLALLAQESTHGYELKSGFERQTAGAWPLNVGQVYQTLARLERDGLVEPAGSGQGQRQSWRITSAGEAALGEWYREPVVEEPPARDELAIKVLLAVAAEAVDVTAILQTSARGDHGALAAPHASQARCGSRRGVALGSCCSTHWS